MYLLVLQDTTILLIEALDKLDRILVIAQVLFLTRSVDRYLQAFFPSKQTFARKVLTVGTSTGRKGILRLSRGRNLQEKAQRNIETHRSGERRL